MDLFKAKVTGFLSVADWTTTLDGLTAKAQRGGELAFLLDILEMTGYDPKVREMYLGWHKQHGQRLRRTAVVTTRPLWRVVISTISLATGGRTRAFESVDAAQQWISTS
jgi:hypothetical protein